MSSSTRGRGGKFQKPKRGGGKHFSRDLHPVNAAGEQESMWAEPRTKHASDSSASDSGSDSDSDSSAGAPGPSRTTVKQSSTAELSREERRAAARARREAAAARQKAADRAPGDLPTSSDDSSDDDDEGADMPANPNHTAKAAKQASIVPTAASTAAAETDAAAASTAKGGAGGKKAPSMSQLSRREREALQAQQAKERYQKLHAEGKTDEARADMARLRLIREKRDADAAVKAAELEEKRANDKAKTDQLARDERQRALAAAKKDRLKKK